MPGPAPVQGEASCPGWQPHLPAAQAAQEPSVQREKEKMTLSPCVRVRVCP